jgi:hypothetical protein
LSGKLAVYVIGTVCAIAFGEDFGFFNNFTLEKCLEDLIFNPCTDFVGEEIALFFILELSI